MLTLACARLLDYPGTRHHKLAAAVEFIHTATLLHDDVVDGSGLRRGKRTANIIWGNPASVLVGDFLFSRSFELMVEDGSLKVLKILSRASRGDRRGRGRPADRPAPGRDRRGPVSRDHRRQDRGPVRRRLPDRRGGRRARARRSSRRSTPTAATSASPSSWSTTRSTMPRTRRRWARASATISATARSPCRSSSLMRAARTTTAASGATRWPGAAPATRTSPRRSACSATSGALDDTLERARHYGQRAIDALGPFPAGRAKAALIEAVEFAIAPRLLMKRFTSRRR